MAIALAVVLGVAAVAGAQLDRAARAKLLFRALSAATSRTIVPGVLTRVPSPESDARTRTLWQRTSAVTAVDAAWVTDAGDKVIRGSTAGGARFYLVAYAKPNGRPVGILLPEEADMAAMRWSPFASLSAHYALLSPKDMSSRDRERVIRSIVRAAP